MGDESWDRLSYYLVDVGGNHQDKMLLRQLPKPEIWTERFMFNSAPFFNNQANSIHFTNCFLICKVKTQFPIIQFPEEKGLNTQS